MQYVARSVSAGLLLLASLASPVGMTGSGKRAPLSTTSIEVHKPAFEKAIRSKDEILLEVSQSLYQELNLKKFGLSEQAFQYAYKGYARLKEKGLLNREDVLSICDFSQSSRRKRMYIIDVEDKKVLLNTYVAHGRNSGGEYAKKFSNRPESHQSSLGFYITRNTYYGEHGLALKIDGVDKGFNDLANARNIVVHGSDYVGAGFIRYNKFNGRSFGCPAVPKSQSEKVINAIKRGTCLFIYHPSRKYLTQSRILNS